MSILRRIYNYISTNYLFAFKILILNFILLNFTSCTSYIELKERLELEGTSFDKIDNWNEDNHAEALKAFAKSCIVINKKNPDNFLHIDERFGKVENWQEICRKIDLKTLNDKNLAKDFFVNNFTPYKVIHKNQNKGLFTGYYEIGMIGSLNRKGAFQTPLYARPNDLENGEEYYSRAEIEFDNAIEDKNLEIVWLNDPIDSFFLHIQGSGLVFLEDNKILRVGYNGKNNYAYTAIGKNLIDSEEIKKEDISAQSIRKWLNDEPILGHELMNENESYIFFRKLDTDGPIGGSGAVLTPTRSLAIDDDFYAYGLPIWLKAEITGNEKFPKYELESLLIAQDTGGAIKGQIRGDIFFGFGQMAAEYAGAQKSKGEVIIFLPLNVTKIN